MRTLLLRTLCASVLLFASSLPVFAADLDFTGAPSGSFLIGPQEFPLFPSGGTPPYTFSYAPNAPVIPGFRVTNQPDVNCNLSPGATGEFLGVPMAAGTYSTTLRLTDSVGGIKEKAVSFEIRTLNVVATIPANRGVGNSVSIPLTGVGGVAPYSFSLASGTLPPGTSLDSSRALISGQLTTSGYYSFSIQVTDATGKSAVASFGMSVGAMRLLNSDDGVLPNATVGLSYSQTLLATGGVPPYTYKVQSGGLPTGLTLSSSGLISGTPQTSSNAPNLTVRVTDKAGTYQDFNISVFVIPTTAGTFYSITSTIYIAVGQTTNYYHSFTGGLPPYQYTLAPGSTVPEGTTFGNGSTSGSYPGRPWTHVYSQVPGTYTLKAQVTDAAGNTVVGTITIIVSKIAVLNGYYGCGNPTPVVNTPLTPQKVVAYGGTPPYTFQPSATPLGVAISNDGVISGTPLVTGSPSLVYSVRDSAGVMGQVSTSMTIGSGTSFTLSLPSQTFTFLRGSTLGTYSISASGSPLSSPNYTVSIVSGSLPPGLTLLTGTTMGGSNSTTAAQFTGTLTTSGRWTVVLRVTDAAGNAGQSQVIFDVLDLTELKSPTVGPGVVGMPYSTDGWSLSGGTPPYHFQTSPGALPPGLVMNPDTGAVTGTPSASGAFSYTVTVSDAAGRGIMLSYTLTVYPAQITTPGVLVGSVGHAVRFNLTASPAGSYVYTSANLPAGLSIDNSTGAIVGTPATVGTYTFSVTASQNGSPAAVRSFTLFVTSDAARRVISGLQNSWALTLRPGITTCGALPLSGGTPPYTISVVAPSTMPAGTSLGLTDACASVSSLGPGRPAYYGNPVTPGAYSVRVRVTDAAGLSQEGTLQFNATPLFLATTTMKSGFVNTPYTFQLTGMGGGDTYSYALTPTQSNTLPPGLSMTSTGLFTGTPTATGSYAVDLTVTSGSYSFRTYVTLTVYANSTMRYMDLSLNQRFGDVPLGRGLSTSLSTTGGSGAQSWTILGALPPGFSLLTTPGSSTATLTGAPSQVGSYTFGLRVDDSTGNFVIRYTTMNVSPVRVGPINFSPNQSTQLPAGQTGTPYSFALTGYTGRAPYTFIMQYGTILPAGMNFGSTGLLSGTPTEAGSFTLVFLVTDANGATRQMSLSLTIFPAGRPVGMSVGSIQASSPSVGVPYSYTLNDIVYPGFGTAPYSFALSTATNPASTLPPGLTIVPGSGGASDTISGTPTTAGLWTFDLMVTDATGAQALVRNTTLNVGPIALTPSGNTLPPAVEGSVYSQTFTATGGSAPYSLKLGNGSDLPPGMSFTPSGVLSGTPTTFGPFVVWIQVVDAAQVLQQFRYVLNVSPQGTVIPALTLSPSAISVAYTVGDPAPAPVQVSIGTTAGTVAIAARTSGGSWLSLGTTSSSAPGSATVLFNPAGLTPAIYNGALTITSAGASNSPATVPVTLRVNAIAPCAYSLGSTSGTILAAGGSGSIAISTTGACAWSATTTDNWISFASAGSGTGSGTLTFTAQANPGSAPRTGTITIQGLAYTVTQFGSSCAFSINPARISVPATAGAAQVLLSSSASGCAWSAAANDPWLNIQGTASGSDARSVAVTVTMTANSGASRTGTVNIAGQIFSVTQAGAQCTFTLSGAPGSFGPGAASATVNMTAPAGCQWTADPGPSWLAIDGAVQGTGSAQISYKVAANSTTAARSATMLIGGQPWTIAQQGVPCSFSLRTNNPVQPAAGGVGTIDITATGANCSWTASSSAAWLTPNITSGSGASSISFSVAQNTGSGSRSATLSIAGQNVIVNQDGLTCSYTLRATSASLPSGGGTSSVDVIAAPGCSWSASSQAPWITVTSGAASSGSGSVLFSVAPNTAAAPLDGTIQIAGKSFAVHQDAAACVVTLTNATGHAIEGGGPGTFTYTTSASGCSPAVQSYTSWLQVTSSTISGTSGTVTYNASQNSYAGTRSGVIKVGDQSFTVNQDPSTCAYTLTAFGASFGPAGGDGSMPMTVSRGDCGQPGVIPTDPTHMITGTTMSQGSGTYTLNYGVALYQSFIHFVRSAQFDVNGQVYTIKQRSY